MIVTIRGESHACRTATMENEKVVLYLGEYDEHGEEKTSVFIGFSADEIIGVGEPESPITLENRVSDLETDSTEMKEALDMILGGVTE